MTCFSTKQYTILLISVVCIIFVYQFDARGLFDKRLYLHSNKNVEYIGDREQDNPKRIKQSERELRTKIDLLSGENQRLVTAIEALLETIKTEAEIQKVRDSEWRDMMNRLQDRARNDRPILIPEDWKTQSLPILVGEVEGHPSWRLSFPFGSHDVFNGGVKSALEGKKITIDDYSPKYQGIMRNRTPSSVMMDIGANIGLSSLPVAALGYRVVAFEPVPYNLEKLAQSIVVNGFDRLFTIVPMAASHEKGTTKIYIPGTFTDNASLSPESAITNIGNRGGPVKEITIEIIPIDEWIAGQTDIDPTDIVFLKIDVQGFELKVLAGAKKLLTDNIDTMIIQAEFDRRLTNDAKINPSDIDVFMRGIGYDAFLGDSRIRDLSQISKPVDIVWRKP